MTIPTSHGNLTVSGGCVITGTAYASGRITLPGGPDIGGNAIANALTMNGGSEVGAFAQEAIAGVDRIGAACPQRADHRLDIEIALPRRRRTDAMGFVRQPHVHRPGIGFAMHRDRADAHGLGGGDDPHGDLAAIGDQYLAEHQPAESLRASSRRLRMIRPLTTRSPSTRTMPAMWR